MRRDEARAAARGGGHPLARRRDADRRAGGREPRRRCFDQLGLVTREELRGARAPRRAARAPAAARRASRAPCRSRLRCQNRPWRPAGVAGQVCGASACNTERMAQPAQQRNLGRMSEIAQVAVRHGFGYFLETHKLTDLLPWPRRPAALDAEVALDRARPAPARDARRARPDVRQVRPAALDAAGHRPAGHHRRAARAPGRRHAVSVRGGRARRSSEELELPAREALPRVRGDSRSRRRRSARCTAPCSRTGGASRSRCSARTRRGRSRPTSRSSTRRRGSRRSASGRSTSSTRASSSTSSRGRSARSSTTGHEARNAQAFHRNFAGHPHVRIPRVYWSYSRQRVLTLELLEGDAARRPRARRRTRSTSGGGSPT